MIINREDDKFRPIVIKLVTRDELDQLQGLLDYSPLSCIPIVMELSNFLGTTNNEYSRMVEKTVYDEIKAADEDDEELSEDPDDGKKPLKRRIKRKKSVVATVDEDEDEELSEDPDDDKE